MAFPRRARKDAAPLDENALYEYAVAALGRRMQSVAEIKRRMRPRVEAGPEGENKMAAVVARLKEYRYLDDSSFASTYARLRQENEGYGKRRVQMELARKGVHRDLIESTLETAYPSTGEEDLARRYLERKRISKPETAKETARVVRRLVTAGFSIPVVSKILKNWKIELSEEELDVPGNAPGEREE